MKKHISVFLAIACIFMIAGCTDKMTKKHIYPNSMTFCNTQKKN